MRIPSIKLIFAASVIALSFSACDDALSIGSSIVDDQVNVFIDSTFTTSAITIDNNVVLSRSIVGLIGSIDADTYGTLNSDVVSQFMPAINLDTLGVTDESIDKVSLLMRYSLGGFIGDSIVPMGIEVYPLTKSLPSPIYSDFNPKDYYDASKKLGSVIYTATREHLSDSIKKLNYGEIKVELPREFGQKLVAKYREDPSIFAYPEEFAKFFPGLYIKNSYGSGRVMRIEQTIINMDYHTTQTINDKDTVIYNTQTYLAVTPEIICNNNIDYNLSQDLKNRCAQGQTLVVAPAGYDAEIIFPAKDVINRYNNTIGSGLGVINSLDFKIPAEVIANEYNITPPPHLLMVLKSQKEDFFAQNKLTDGKTSFYAEYNSSTGVYDFGSMRQYILDLMDKEQINDEDVTFIITPVNVSTEVNSDYYNGTTVYVTSITPYVLQPVMARLLMDKAQVKFVYSRQTLIQ